MIEDLKTLALIIAATVLIFLSGFRAGYVYVILHSEVNRISGSNMLVVSVDQHEYEYFIPTEVK